jgi:hypothetical protein
MVEAYGSSNPKPNVESKIKGSTVADEDQPIPISDKSPSDSCIFNFKELTVLAEHRVDFNNMQANGIDLKPELLVQG